MKKFFLLITPLLIAVLIFFGILFFLDRRSGKGALQVTAVPKSKVYINNKLVGSTPLCLCDLSQMLLIGDYSIKLVPDSGDFLPFEEKITISKSTLTAFDRTFADNGSNDGSVVSLIPLDDKKEIELLVISLPDKANVFLDNNPVGTTPLLLKQISESDHDLRLTLDGYRDKALKIKTALGYKLSSLVFLGINPDLSSVPIIASSAASPIATASASILILNTPTGFLRVRESNSILSNEIAKVNPGESYEFVEEKNSWFKIKLTDGRLGWVNSSYVIKK
jgi:hypothetical protein